MLGHAVIQAPYINALGHALVQALNINTNEMHEAIYNKNKNDVAKHLAIK